MKLKVTLLLPLLLWINFSFAESFVKIDSLVGNAEIQRAGHQNWIFVSKTDKLYNNDVIRVHGKGHARLQLPDGSTVYVHQNSQVLINLIEGKDNAIIGHTTVFFGALYFVIKKIAPRDLVSTGTKVYTPTAVVSLRGTSFAIYVDKKGGATDVKMVNGTVLVRNIIKNISLFLGAPYQTRVEMNTDPIVPKAVLKSDIDSLMAWVPEYVIKEEMTKQLTQSKRDQHIISGKYEDKMLVTPLTNGSNYTGPWAISNGLSSFLTVQIRKSLPNLTVVALDSTPTDPIACALLNKARYVLTGSIESFDITQHAEISAQADEYREFAIGQVRIKFQLLDAAGKKIICEETCSGEFSVKNIKDNSWTIISKLPFDLKNEAFSKSLIGIATQQMLDQASEKITRYLTM